MFRGACSFIRFPFFLFFFFILQFGGGFSLFFCFLFPLSVRTCVLGNGRVGSDVMDSWKERNVAMRNNQLGILTRGGVGS